MALGVATKIRLLSLVHVITAKQTLWEFVDARFMQTDGIRIVTGIVRIRCFELSQIVHCRVYVLNA